MLRQSVLNYFIKKCNILTRFLVDFYVTNIRLLWKCPFRLQRYSFITTLFLGTFDDVITKFYCISIQAPERVRNQT
jgi:hypothetical protein